MNHSSWYVVFFALLGVLSQSSLAEAYFTREEIRSEIEWTNEEENPLFTAEVEDHVYEYYHTRLFADTPHIWEVLNALPVIKIELPPAPRSEYDILINGKSYPVTDRREYGVPWGQDIRLSIKRSGFDTCEWSGNLKFDTKVTVQCEFKK